MTDGVPTNGPARKLIPLSVGKVPPPAERREVLREAVVQVVADLVLETVPTSERSLYFEQARGLLDEAGWGLDELFQAADEGPARERLFQVLGLS
ncbi:MAG: hypothetical protein J2P14_00700 [Acidothermales bacterium]|nr:hypothetical protein [Acidothermales bacterium]